MKRILITGAAGFIGRRLAALLVEKYSVRCLVRDAARAKDILPAGVELVEGDMTNSASLQAAAAGVDAVVHLAAAKNDEPSILAVNVGGASNLVAACKAEGVKRVINVGTQASRLARRGAYGESKLKSDEILNASGLEVTTLLPSLVYGPRDAGAFGKLARATASAPFVPVIGDGTVRFNPIHVDDLCLVVEACLREPKTAARTFNVGGLETVTLNALIDLIGARIGRQPFKVHLPETVAMLIARALSAVMRSPPLTVSNVLGAVQSAPDADYAAVFDVVGFRPRALSEGMKEV